MYPGLADSNPDQLRTEHNCDNALLGGAEIPTRRRLHYCADGRVGPASDVLKWCTNGQHILMMQ